MSHNHFFILEFYYNFKSEIQGISGVEDSYTFRNYMSVTKWLANIVLFTKPKRFKSIFVKTVKIIILVSTVCHCMKFSSEQTCKFLLIKWKW